MGLDLGGALAVFGTAVAGNAVSLDPGYSMGGKTSNSQNVLGNLLGLLGMYPYRCLARLTSKTIQENLLVYQEPTVNMRKTHLPPEVICMSLETTMSS